MSSWDYGKPSLKIKVNVWYMSFSCSALFLASRKGKLEDDVDSLVFDLVNYWTIDFSVMSI